MQKFTTIHPNYTSVWIFALKKVQCTKTRTLPKLGLVLTHNACQRHPPNLRISNPVQGKEVFHCYRDHGKAMSPGNDRIGYVLEKR